MASKVGIEIVANTADFDRAMGRVQTSLSKLDKSVGGVGHQIDIGFKAMAVAATGVAYALSRVLSQTDDMMDFADAIGIGASELDDLQLAAAGVGVSSDQLNSSLVKLSSNIGEALITKTGSASSALKTLRLNASEISKLPLDQQFTRIAEELSKVDNAATRNALSKDLFGKQGPILLAVAANIRKTREELDAMGLSLSAQDFSNIKAAGDAFDSLGLIINRGLKKALSELAPYIVGMINSLKDAIKEAGGFDVVMGKVATAIKAVVTAAAIFYGFQIGAKIGQIGLFAFEAIKGIVLLTRAIKTMGITAVIAQAMATGGISAIVSLTAGVAGAGAAAFAAEKLFDKMAGTGVEGAAAIASGQADVKDATNDTNLDLDAQNKKLESLNQAFGQKLSGLDAEIKAQDDINNGKKQTSDIDKQIAEFRQKYIDAGSKLGPQAEKQLRTKLETLQSSKEEAKINDVIRGLTEESVGLNSENADLKEINVAMSKLELDFGRDLTDTERERLKIKFESVQKSREDLAIRQAMDKYNNVGIKRSERISGGLELMKQGNPYEEEMKAFEQNQLNLQALKDYYDKMGIDKDLEINNAKQAMELAHQEKLTQIQSDAIATRFRLAGVTNQATITGVQAVDKQMREILSGQVTLAEGAVNVATTVLGEFGKTNKKAFEAYKALAIAQAMISAFRSVPAAFAAGMEAGGPFGPIVGGIYAAMALATTMAQVAQIRNMQYSGRALGGPVMGGTPYLVGESGPELFTPATTGSITRNSDLGQSAPVNVNFTIVANDTQGFDQLLTSRKGVIQQIISDAMLERGQRSMV